MIYLEQVLTRCTWTMQDKTYSFLDESCNINHKSLWATLRSKKNINFIISLNGDNNTITNSKTTCNAMADHFIKAFSNTTVDHFDDNFKSYMDEKVFEFNKKNNDVR